MTTSQYQPAKAPKKKPTERANTQQATQLSTDGATVPHSSGGGNLATIPLIVKDVARVDSRLLATNMQNQHHNTLALIDKYKTELESFGKVLFKTEPLPDSKTGQKERHALLNEDHAFFLVALSRNTPRVVALKVRLVKAFGEARRAAIQHGAEYLPSYHQLHDQIHVLAAGSPNEHFMHMNANKAVNQAVGIEAGQRGALAMVEKSMLCVAQIVAAKAAHGAADRRDIQPRIKTAMLALSAATQIGGAA